jgi:hypothetical protein
MFETDFHPFKDHSAKICKNSNYLNEVKQTLENNLNCHVEKWTIGTYVKVLMESYYNSRKISPVSCNLI